MNISFSWGYKKLFIYLIKQKTHKLCLYLGIMILLPLKV